MQERFSSSQAKPEGVQGEGDVSLYEPLSQLGGAMNEFARLIEAGHLEDFEDSDEEGSTETVRKNIALLGRVFCDFAENPDAFHIRVSPLEERRMLILTRNYGEPTQIGEQVGIALPKARKRAPRMTFLTAPALASGSPEIALDLTVAEENDSDVEGKIRVLKTGKDYKHAIFYETAAVSVFDTLYTETRHLFEMREEEQAVRQLGEAFKPFLQDFFFPQAYINTMGRESLPERLESGHIGLFAYNEENQRAWLKEYAEEMQAVFGMLLLFTENPEAFTLRYYQIPRSPLRIVRMHPTSSQEEDSPLPGGVEVCFSESPRGKQLRFRQIKIEPPEYSLSYLETCVYTRMLQNSNIHYATVLEGYDKERVLDRDIARPRIPHMLTLFNALENFGSLGDS